MTDGRLSVRRAFGLAARVAGLALALVAGGAAASGSHAAAATTSSPWKVVPSPVVNGGLTEVSADSPSDAWAIGLQIVPGATIGSPLIEHRTAGGWTVAATPAIPVPCPTRSIAQPQRVKAFSPTDVWVVGTMENCTDGDPYQSFEAHWDGASWTVQEPPRGYAMWIEGLDGTSDSNLWMTALVGNAVVGYHGMLLHGGTQGWTILLQAASQSSGYGPVVAISPTLAYMAGCSDCQHGDYVFGHGGATAGSWTLSPNPTGYADEMTASSANDIWTLEGHSVSHWNGRTWVRRTAPGGNRMGFSGIAEHGSNDVWVGGFRNGGYNVYDGWDGAGWTTWGGANLGPGTGIATAGMAAIPGTTNGFWAVGTATNYVARIYQPAILHCSC